MNKNELKFHIIKFFWDQYKGSASFLHALLQDQQPLLDHFAIIDLPPSKNTGIPFLQEIFEISGFEKRGQGYLPEKYNDFIWLTDPDAYNTNAKEALPQIVIADFRLDSLSRKSQEIISQLQASAPTFDTNKYRNLVDSNPVEAYKLFELFFNTRAWGLPSSAEYEQIKSENELLAWTMLFGRKVNHFGLNFTFDSRFNNLEEFNEFIRKSNLLTLNSSNGEIKGGPHHGIAQSSSMGLPIEVATLDAKVVTNDSFMEFVWRYPQKENPTKWSHYYTNFVAQNANHVIESLLKN